MTSRTSDYVTTRTQLNPSFISTNKHQVLEAQGGTSCHHASPHGPQSAMWERNKQNHPSGALETMLWLQETVEKLVRFE